MNGLRLAGAMITAATLITATACSSLPGHRAVAHSGTSASSTPESGSRPSGSATTEDDPTGPSGAASAPRPADIDLRDVTKACSAFKAFDATKVGVEHAKPEEADDESSEAGFKISFPMADHVVQCQWLDYDSLRSVQVGVVDGMGVDKFTPEGGWHPMPGIESDLTTISGYRTFLSRHTVGFRNCQAMVDIHDDQILWISATDQKVPLTKSSSIATECKKVPAMVEEALRVAKQI